MATFSVIIPVFNKEKYLRQCLDSILKNTFKDLEVICVNDGSTDNSLTILNEYQKLDSRIKVISQNNEGVSSARNSGLECAHSEFVSFIDPDDYIAIDTYENCIKVLDNNDLVVFGTEIFGEAYLEKRDSEKNIIKLKFNGETDISDKLFLNSDTSCCNKIFKKSIIDKYNLRFLNGRCFEDIGFLFSYYSCIKKIYFINQNLYFYRRHYESISSNLFNGSVKSIDHIYILEDIFFCWCKNFFIDTNYLLYQTIFNKYVYFALTNAPKNFRIIILYKSLELAKRVKKFNNKFESDWLINTLLQNRRKITFYYMLRTIISKYLCFQKKRKEKDCNG